MRHLCRVDSHCIRVEIETCATRGRITEGKQSNASDKSRVRRERGFLASPRQRFGGRLGSGVLNGLRGLADDIQDEARLRQRRDVAAVDCVSRGAHTRASRTNC